MEIIIESGFMQLNDVATCGKQVAHDMTYGKSSKRLSSYGCDRVWNLKIGGN